MKTQYRLPNVSNLTLLFFSGFCLWQQSARGLLQVITKSQVLSLLKSNFKSSYFTFSICDFEALFLCLSLSRASGQYLYLSVSWRTEQENISSALIFVHSIAKCKGRWYIWFSSFWRHQLTISSLEGSPGYEMCFSPLSEAFPSLQREPCLFTELCENILHVLIGMKNPHGGLLMDCLREMRQIDWSS